MVSMAHYRKTLIAVDSDFEQDLVDVIEAREGSHFGGWSQHVRRWQERADLVIRFEDLIQDPMERRLFQIVSEKAPAVSEALDRREYEKATRLFGQAFFGPVNDFFDKVMVNVEDSEIRRNRQALMKQIHTLYAGRLADLSLLSRFKEE